MAKPPRRDRSAAVLLSHATLQRLPVLYLLWAVMFGATLAWVTPPWQNPDEPAHAKRAVQISGGGMLGRRLGRNAGGQSDNAVDASYKAVASLAFIAAHKTTAAMLNAADAVRWGRLAPSAFDNTATYPPFLYAAAAAAARIGRASHMHVAATLRLMRLFDALAAAALGALALATARRTRLAIAAVLLLPMSAALAASPSQDALLIPLAAWVAAVIDRARTEPASTPAAAAQCGLAAALLVIALARPPYVPLAALLLLLPPTAGRSLRMPLAFGVAAATVLWAGFVAWHISVPMNAADPARQAALLLRHPVGFLMVLGGTLQDNLATFAAGAVGILGWLDTPLPRGFLIAGGGAVALALLSAAGPDPYRGGRWRHRTLVGAGAVLAAALGVFASIYIIWSAPGASTISGIQGRYFLPLLPALALAMPNLGRWTAPLRPLALLAVLLLGAVGPVVTISTLIDRYYLAP